MLESLLQMITIILISIIVEVVISSNVSKWRKNEYNDNRIARQEKKVYLNRMLKKICTVLMAFVAIIGVLLVIFPQISAWLGFDFKITLLVLWIPLIFDIIVLMPLFGKFNYSEDKFEYTNVFGFTRIFQYENILELIETKRRVRIVTANKKICVWKGFCGAEAFIDCLKEKIDRGKH